MDERLAVALLAFGVGAVVTDLLARGEIRRAPEHLVRTNYRGIAVPAVLGRPLIAGVVLGHLLGIAAIGILEQPYAALASFVLVPALMFVGGARDDVRGDESDRGFKGHLSAAGRGRLTGGLIKILFGLVAGAVAGFELADGRGGFDWVYFVQTVLLVALGANLFNLLDRAPGRAGKVFLLAAIPLTVTATTGYWIVGAASIGAVIAALRFDLTERAMLGDSGSNPLGALVGLGLALGLTGTWRWVAVGVLLALNLASERWSFSKVIEATPGLRDFDRWGRTHAK